MKYPLSPTPSLTPEKKQQLNSDLLKNCSQKIATLLENDFEKELHHAQKSFLEDLSILNALIQSTVEELNPKSVSTLCLAYIALNQYTPEDDELSWRIILSHAPQLRAIRGIDPLIMHENTIHRIATTVSQYAQREICIS